MLVIPAFDFTAEPISGRRILGGKFCAGRCAQINGFCPALRVVLLGCVRAVLACGLRVHRIAAKMMTLVMTFAGVDGIGKLKLAF
jgi:hypothetical protein